MPANTVAGCVRTSLRVISLAIPVLLLFAGTLVVCALAVSWHNDTPYLSAATLLPGTMCTLIFWLFAAVIHLKKETALVPVGDPALFRERIRAELVDLGYQAVQLSTDTILFRPAFTSYLLGGWISLSIDNGCARIIGPKVRLERLVQRLRLGSFVAKDHKAVSSSALRQGKQLIKRVRIGFRVTREQWPGVQESVLRVLESEGADVICDVNILAQRENGITATTIESQVCGWLRDHDIKALLHKEYVQPPEKLLEQRDSHAIVELDKSEPFSGAGDTKQDFVLQQH